MSDIPGVVRLQTHSRTGASKRSTRTEPKSGTAFARSKFARLTPMRLPTDPRRRPESDESDLSVLGKGERVFHVDPEIAHRILDLAMAICQPVGLSDRYHERHLLPQALHPGCTARQLFSRRRECGQSQSQVSRIAADLEASLGARLLACTTRAVTPTEAGADLLVRMEPILAALEEAEESLCERGRSARSVRMSMPTSFGIQVAVPRLAAFAQRHPRLHLQFLMEDRRQDLTRDAVDVAFRLGRLVDATATAELIATIPRVIVASPDYLAAHGEPGRPEDLSGHRIVGGTAASSTTVWRFSRGDEELEIAVDPIFSTNENEAIQGIISDPA